MLSFSASAGQSFTVQIANVTTTPANTPVTVQIYNNSNYGQIASATTTTGTTFNLSNLSAGTYVVWIGPQTPATTSMQVSLTAPNITAVPTDGSSTTIMTTSPGQNAYVTFNATAGQSISAALTNLSIAPSSNSSVNMTLYDTNGNELQGQSQNCSPGSNGCEVEWIYLPTTGTYYLTVVPDSQFTMNFTMTVSTNVTGQLTPNIPTNVNLSSMGQSAALTFTVASGQNVTITVSNVTATPSGTTTYVGLDNSSQGYITGQFTTSGVTFNANGWSPGTYIVWIANTTPAISSMQVLATYN
jgi:hypothetical protein